MRPPRIGSAAALRPVYRGVLVTACGAAALATLAACGSSSSGGAPVASSTTDTAAATSSASASGTAHKGAWAAYRQCLAQNGVNLPKHKHHKSADASSTEAPDSTGASASGEHHHKMGPPAGVSEATWQAAQNACASLKPAHKTQ